MHTSDIQQYVSGILFSTLFALLLLGIPSATAEAASYYVSTSGNDSASGTSTAPFRTLSKGVSVLSAGDTLYVKQGTYNERLRVDVSGTATNPISIMPDGNDAVILDLQNNNDKIVFINGSYINVSGFEIQNSDGYCVDLAGQYINFTDNKVHHCWDHGIYTDGQHITIDNNEMYLSCLMNENRDFDNQWPSGIKVRVGGENITISNNTVYNNYGEGIAATRGIDILVANNTVYDNYAVQIYIDNSINATVNQNHAYCTNNSGFEYLDGQRPNGIGIGEEPYSGWGAQLENILIKNNIVASCENGVAAWASDVNGGLNNVRILNNTLWGSESLGQSAIAVEPSPNNSQNTVIANNIVQQPDGKVAWISSRDHVDMYNNFWVGGPPDDWRLADGPDDRYGDPLLAGGSNPSPTNPLDFRLTSSSTAIGGAAAESDVTSDYFGNARDNAPDMGAAEYGTTSTSTPTPTPSSCPEDINEDGIVDLRDYSLLVLNFFSSTPDPIRADINSDGIVDLRDYSRLVLRFFQYC